MVAPVLCGKENAKSQALRSNASIIFHFALCIMHLRRQYALRKEVKSWTVPLDGATQLNL